MLDITFYQSLAIILIFFFGHWYLSLFTQSFFYHRYASHEQFTMSKFWEKVFYILSFVFQGSSYLDPKSYAMMHRMHHDFADTPEDPHSPKNSPNAFMMMWDTKLFYSAIEKGKKIVSEKYTRNLPDWRSFTVFASAWPSRLFWGVSYVVFYVLFAKVWWLYLLLPIHFFMGPFHGVVINWFAHKIGYMNYHMRNTSRNLMNWDLLMWGESLHNNHHRKPYAANFAQKWFELDPMYPIIKVMHWMHIIRLREFNR